MRRRAEVVDYWTTSPPTTSWEVRVRLVGLAYVGAVVAVFAAFRVQA